MDREEIQEIFTRNLKAFMARDNINQTELARALGASVGQVSAWVHGIHVPRTNHLAAMTVLFGCQVSDLLTDKTKDPQPIEGCESGPVGYDQLTDSEKALIDAMVAKILEQRSQQ